MAPKSGPRQASASNPRPVTPGSSLQTAAFTQSVLPMSTPISSPQYHDAVVSVFVKARRSPKIADVFATCLQTILEQAGINTVGQAQPIKQNPSGNKRVADGALQCLGSAAP